VLLVDQPAAAGDEQGVGRLEVAGANADTAQQGTRSDLCQGRSPVGVWPIQSLAVSSLLTAT